MKNSKLRQEIHNAISNLPPELLAELLEFIKQLQFRQRLEKAEKDFDERRAVNWRMVRSDA